jgi:Transposase DNA-binding/Transposase DDE domain
MEIAQEFSGAKLGDPRRAARLVQVATAIAKRPEQSFPKLFDEAGLEGLYRFFGNGRVSLEALIQPHQRETWRRAGHYPTTLVVHDTTTMSFRVAGQREGVPTTQRGNQQFLAHTSLAVAADGTRRPLGVVALSTHDQASGSVHDRWSDHIDAAEEANPGTTSLVHVADREADDYEILAHLVEKGRRFVIRAQHDRYVDESGRRLSTLVGEAKIVLEREALVSQRKPQHRGDSKQRRAHPERVARLVKLAFSAVPVTIPRARSAPKTTPASLDINVVHVSEVGAPEGEKPIEWTLLTTEPIGDAASVLQIVDWYRARWVIEEFFKVLKTGCAYEKRQLESFESLRNALAVLAPIAWHLLALRSVAREQPEVSATEVLSEDHLQVLRLAGRVRLPVEPTAREVYLAIARLGGHLPRNGEPGWLVLARGRHELETLVTGWRLHPARSSDQS